MRSIKSPNYISYSIDVQLWLPAIEWCFSLNSLPFIFNQTLTIGTFLSSLVTHLIILSILIPPITAALLPIISCEKYNRGRNPRYFYFRLKMLLIIRTSPNIMSPSANVIGQITTSPVSINRPANNTNTNNANIHNVNIFVTSFFIRALKRSLCRMKKYNSVKDKGHEAPSHYWLTCPFSWRFPPRVLFVLLIRLPAGPETFSVPAVPCTGTHDDRP